MTTNQRPRAPLAVLATLPLLAALGLIGGASIPGAAAAESSQPAPASALPTAAAAAAAPDTGATFLGVATCASTVCHGALIARDGNHVLQNEYIVWSEEDRHARAYEILLDDRSKAIAANLGIGPAEKASLCLDCHATNAAASRRGDKFVVSDGVSCESCHGAASNWVAAHDDAGRSHADNVRAGMNALDDAVVRARVCASCHVGDEERFVGHRIMAAGHPRTNFELDTFTYLEPRHYRVDDDYKKRKGDIDGARAWSVGQAVVLEDYLRRLSGSAASRGSGGAGASTEWPEFALFDCFSCHHAIGSQAAGGGGVRGASAVGLPGLLRGSAMMYEAAAEVAGLPASARIDPSLRDLDNALAGGAAGGGPARARELLTRVRSGAELLDKWDPSQRDLEALLKKLSSPDAIARYRSYSDAEQATMAVQAVVATLIDRGYLSGDRRGRLRAALDGLFDATRNESGFVSTSFQTAMGRLAAAVGSGA